MEIPGYSSQVKIQILALRLASISQTRRWCIMPTYFKISVIKFVKGDLDLHCLRRLHESVQTTVYLSEISYATMQTCPMALTLAMLGPLIRSYMCSWGWPDKWFKSNTKRWLMSLSPIYRCFVQTMKLSL